MLLYGRKKSWWENNTYDIKRIKTESQAYIRYVILIHNMYRVSLYICNTYYVWIWMDYMNTAAADICARKEGTNVVYVEGAIKGEGSKWPSYTALPIAGQCNTHSKEECICISFIILRIIYIKRVIWNEDKGETEYITNYLGSKNQFFLLK